MINLEKVSYLIENGSRRNWICTENFVHLELATLELVWKLIVHISLAT
jgi:hypothetical protein